MACYPLGTATDMLELPQFEHRGFFVEQEHPTLGKLTFPGVSYTIAGRGAATAQAWRRAWGSTTRRSTASGWGTTRRGSRR